MMEKGFLIGQFGRKRRKKRSLLWSVIIFVSAISIPFYISVIFFYFSSVKARWARTGKRKKEQEMPCGGEIFINSYSPSLFPFAYHNLPH